jgi:hypothetical protein
MTRAKFRPSGTSTSVFKGGGDFAKVAPFGEKPETAPTYWKF